MDKQFNCGQSKITAVLGVTPNSNTRNCNTRNCNRWGAAFFRMARAGTVTQLSAIEFYFVGLWIGNENAK